MDRQVAPTGHHETLCISVVICGASSTISYCLGGNTYIRPPSIMTAHTWEYQWPLIHPPCSVEMKTISSFSFSW